MDVQDFITETSTIKLDIIMITCINYSPNIAVFLDNLTYCEGKQVLEEMKALFQLS